MLMPRCSQTRDVARRHSPHAVQDLLPTPCQAVRVVLTVCAVSGLSASMACGRSTPHYTDLDHVAWPHDVTLTNADLARVPSARGRSEGYCDARDGPVECQTLQAFRGAFPSAHGTLIYDEHDGLLSINDSARSARTIGARGGEIGLYQTVTDAWEGGDGRTVVWDATLNRVTWYDGAGRYIGAASTLPDHATREGHVSAVSAWEMIIDPADEDDQRVPARLVRVTPAGVNPSAALVIPHPPVVQAGMRLMPNVIDPTPLWAVAADGGIILVRDHTFRIEMFDSAGHPRARIRGEPSGDVVRAADVDAAARDVMRGFSTAWQDRIRRYVVGSRAPRVGSPVPEVTALRPLPDGTIWVRRFPDATRDSVAWIRVARDGAVTRRVRLGVHDLIVSGSDSAITVTANTSPVRLTKFRLRP